MERRPGSHGDAPCDQRGVGSVSKSEEFVECSYFSHLAIIFSIVRARNSHPVFKMCRYNIFFYMSVVKRSS